jgi:hypothetical protein
LTEASIRAVPLGRSRRSTSYRRVLPGDLLFPGRALRLPRPAQLQEPRLEAGSGRRRIEPFRRIDRHYGQLARDGREHAIRLLDGLNVVARALL